MESRKESDDNHNQSLDIDIGGDEMKNSQKQQRQKLINSPNANQTKKQKYRQDNFVVGAGHAFFVSDAQENFDEKKDNEVSTDEKDKKIGKEFIGFGYSDGQIEMQEKDGQQSTKASIQETQHSPQYDQDKSHTFALGKLSIIPRGSKIPKYLPWLFLVFSVVLGASIPTWILHYPAKKYLRICWRYFMTSFMLIPLLALEYKNPKYQKLYTLANLFDRYNLWKVFLSSLGSSLWFGFILFAFDYTSVSHAMLLGNIQNFFLSLWRVYFKKQKALEVEIVGQVLICIGISLIIGDSITMDELINVDKNQFIMTSYLNQSWFKRIVLGDILCLSVSVLMCKFSLLETEIKSIYPPYLSIFLNCVFSAFVMIIISWFVEATGISSEGVSGWTDIFQLSNFLSYMTLSLFSGVGLFLSYMYIGKYFIPVVSASVFLFEPIVATMLIFIFSVQMLPGPIACLGYVFMIPGMFLILLARHILSLKSERRHEHNRLDTSHHVSNINQTDIDSMRHELQQQQEVKQDEIKDTEPQKQQNQEQQIQQQQDSQQQSSQ